jgi:hypothetical protein
LRRDFAAANGEPSIEQSELDEQRGDVRQGSEAGAARWRAASHSFRESEKAIAGSYVPLLDR